MQSLVVDRSFRHALRRMDRRRFPRRARIVAARLDTYRPSSPTASTWLRASETRSPPTWCAALRSARAITCSIHLLIFLMAAGLLTGFTTPTGSRSLPGLGAGCAGGRDRVL